ncbi:hypothetical protein E8F20_06855 [Pseudomonas sp. BN415]|uniref:hypothetical protein n=1 Tax=Pseudomonas sp. BN415 TaxID=2567889 RepID=UPI002456908A|nr:hypothetical protein [Pseudomonas sp. BN415]MDH4581592.1 hypothetical protein [Pseudomonas sp. BN415]
MGECVMYGLPRYRYSVLRLILAGWVAMLLVMAFQGCVLRAQHDHAKGQDAFVATQQTPHTCSCPQNTGDAVTAINSLPHPSGLDSLGWANGLLVPALLLIRSNAFASLALRSPVPSRPPARLMFVRFND